MCAYVSYNEITAFADRQGTAFCSVLYTVYKSKYTKFFLDGKFVSYLVVS